MFSPSSPCHVTPVYQSTYLNTIYYKVTSCFAWSQTKTLTLRRVMYETHTNLPSHGDEAHVIKDLLAEHEAINTQFTTLQDLIHGS